MINCPFRIKKAELWRRLCGCPWINPILPHGSQNWSHGRIKFSSLNMSVLSLSGVTLFPDCFLYWIAFCNLFSYLIFSGRCFSVRGSPTAVFFSKGEFFPVIELYLWVHKRWVGNRPSDDMWGRGSIYIFVKCSTRLCPFSIQKFSNFVIC